MKSWKYPYPVHFAKLPSKLEIAYVDEGNGPLTLLCIHGLGSNLHAWKKNIDILKKHFRCIAIDLPGYGKSGKGDFDFSMSFFAQNIEAFIEKMELENVCLLGHSMGGQIAVHTVLRMRDKIKKLALVAPAGFEVFTEKEGEAIMKMVSPEILKNLPKEQIVKNFEANFFDMPDDAQFMIADRMEMRKTEEYDHFCRMIPKCVKGMLDEPVFSKLNQIDVPTLVLFGEEDMLIPNRIFHPELTPKAVAEMGREQLSNSILKMIPQAGHFLQWEQPEPVNSAISLFLQT